MEFSLQLENENTMNKNVSENKELKESTNQTNTIAPKNNNNIVGAIIIGISTIGFIYGMSLLDLEGFKKLNISINN